MLRQILIFISAIGFWMPAVAQDKVPALPKNTVDCKQFKKTGPKEWIEVGTAVFDLGGIKDINLTDQPVTPGYFKFGGIDLYPVLEGKCGDTSESRACAATGIDGGRPHSERGGGSKPRCRDSGTPSSAAGQRSRRPNISEQES